MRTVNPPPMAAEWLGVHPSHLEQFGELYGDGSTSHWFGHPLTGVPLYGDWSTKPGTIRVHTVSGDVRVPWDLATNTAPRHPQWREPSGDLPRPEPEPGQVPAAARIRNPRVGCEQFDGTWIHGSPHDCPRWARG